MAKQKFRSFFRKKFITCSIVALIISAVAIAGLYLAYSLVTECIILSDFTVTQNKLMTLEDVNEPFRANAQHMIVGMFSESSDDRYAFGFKEEAMALFNTDTGEAVCYGERAVFTVIKDENDTNLIYKCMDTDVMEYLRKFDINSTTFNVEGVYYKADGTFRPGKLIIREFDENAALGTEGDIIDTMDFTPVNMDGYTYTDRNRIFICLGADSDSDIVKTIKTASADNNYTIDCSLINKTCYENVAEFQVDGVNYLIVSIGYKTVWNNLCAEAVWIIVICLAIGAIVALVSAKIAYTKYSAQYDSDEYRRTMVNALAHDLKSPLMAISGYAENINSGMLPDKTEHYSAAIIENTKFMNSIIESTLQLSRLEAVTKLSKEPIDMVMLCSELYEKYSPQAEDRGISLKTEGSCVIQADRELMTKAIDNLLANAVKYADNGGSCTIKADSRSLSITNTFTGETGKTPDELCRPFVSGDDSRTDRTGTGMGLSIVKSICDMHGFSFEVKLGGGEFTAAIRF
ncbi:MAG: ATP-binding protein [Oscillospiraceae bacterium]